ncbi:MAG: hypothetical protein CM15mP120_25420 [Pseudomonadota bacterium]|nr:MAG: hypothetical protein CM15mP120_25420 [Pseudomonadota bacterium]
MHTGRNCANSSTMAMCNSPPAAKLTMAAPTSAQKPTPGAGLSPGLSIVHLANECALSPTVNCACDNSPPARTPSPNSPRGLKHYRCWHCSHDIPSGSWLQSKSFNIATHPGPRQQHRYDTCCLAAPLPVSGTFCRFIRSRGPRSNIEPPRSGSATNTPPIRSSAMPTSTRSPSPTPRAGNKRESSQISLAEECC